jgi:hypothetical protein
MNAFKQGAFSNSGSHHQALSIIALGIPASDEAPAVVWHLRVGDARSMEQRAIERWENEGGEIPNKQRNQAASFKV